jgi:hypothetical protein
MRNIGIIIGAGDRAPKIGSVEPLPDIVPRDRVCSIGDLLSGGMVTVQPVVPASVAMKCPHCGVFTMVKPGAWERCECGATEHYAS